MEIEDIRKELNTLLKNIVDHSQKYSEERPIPSLEISFVLSKINKMQERLAVLKHLLEEKELVMIRGKKAPNESIIKEEKYEVDFDDDDDELTTEQVVKEISAESTSKKTTDIEHLPIPLLIDALSLNDRYLYANELFSKDMNAFNEFVKSIDARTNLNDAMSLVTTSNWDDENEHVQAFIGLIERRFS